MGFKKRTASLLKPNIFSIQIFLLLRTTTKPNNHSKQGFYTKRDISNLQTSIHTKFHTQIHTKIPYISIPDFFFSLNFSSSLLLLFFFLSSFLLFFSLLLFSLPLHKSPTKMRSFRSYDKAMFGLIQFFTAILSSLSHLFIILTYSISYFNIQSFLLTSFGSLIGNLQIYP